MALNPRQRQQIDTMDRETRRLERLGIREALRQGAGLRRPVLAAVRDGRPLGAAIQDHLRGLAPLLLDACRAAHVMGRRRVLLDVPQDRLPQRLRLSSVYESTLDMLVRRLGLTETDVDELELIYGPAVRQVLQNSAATVTNHITKALLKVTREQGHLREGIRAVGDAMSKSGITPESDYMIETIFRTQTQVAYNAGRWNQLQDPDLQEIVWGFEYVTVGDDRVRPTHVGLDGVKAPKDHPLWRSIWPPNGWSCRCSTLTLYDPEDSNLPPATVEVDGVTVVPGPDRGWDYNPGQLARDLITVNAGARRR